MYLITLLIVFKIIYSKRTRFSHTGRRIICNYFAKRHFVYIKELFSPVEQHLLTISRLPSSQVAGPRPFVSVDILRQPPFEFEQLYFIVDEKYLIKSR